jgi:putative transposase
MDFVMDALSSGRRLKCLTVVDDFTKEAIELVLDHSITGDYVTRALDQAVRFRGATRAIRTDQGPEFTGRALDQWAYHHGVDLKLIQVGKPTSERLYRKLQRQVPRRMPERALVRHAR